LHSIYRSRERTVSGVGDAPAYPTWSAFVPWLASQRRAVGGGVWQITRRAQQALLRDWRGTRRVACGAALLLATSLVVLTYYLNHPHVEIYPDTNGYIASSQHILSRGQLVDPVRLPGYSLLLALAVVLAPRNSLALLSAIQGALFIVATLEVYALALLVLRRTWQALLIGLLVGTNLYLLKYVKPIISDGLALWLTVSLALAAVIFLRTLRPRDLWLVAALTLALFMTRPEWIYAPPLLFAYLLVAAARRGRLRRVLPHALGAIVLLYVVLGLYIHQNAVQNRYAGVTAVQNVNLLGKVMQYHMQNEVPPRYAPVAHVVNAYLARGGISPWALVNRTPALRANRGALAGAYAAEVIEHHPLAFLGHSIPTMFSSLSLGYTADDFQTISAIQPHGPFAPLLVTLRAISAGIYVTYVLFPLVALPWAALCCWRRTARLWQVEAMGAVALLGLYALILTTIGGYGDYARIHTAFNPLMIVVIWGGVLAIGSWWGSRRSGVAVSVEQPAP
jgi:hypothetical protein